MADGGATGKGFRKGKSGNPGGVKKGTNLPAETRAAAAREMAVRDFAQKCVDDPGFDIKLIRELAKPVKGKPKDAYSIEERLEAMPYLEGVFLRMKLNMAPHLERFVLEHLWGSPKKVLEIKAAPRPPMAAAVAAMNEDELQMFARLARRMIASQSTVIEGEVVRG